MINLNMAMLYYFYNFGRCSTISYFFVFKFLGRSGLAKLRDNHGIAQFINSFACHRHPHNFAEIPLTKKDYGANHLR